MTIRTRWSRSSVTTSASPPIWEGTGCSPVRREGDALRALRRRLTVARAATAPPVGADLEPGSRGHLS